ncbi:hypothetical protein [Methanobrevibacter sp.]|uniref:hypothetical protein n=1 Tax=Methanobrevibacter sp. TaxID=66852 RepID=UPI0025FDB726|nr:hypothetical protein [Methanobrevibacter sp.]MBR4447815.1 hypothetical protein [Methanobrevibacter sp.]
MQKLLGIPKVLILCLSNILMGVVMIFNKTISIILSGLFLLLLMLLFSIISIMFFNRGLVPFIGVVLFVFFYFVTRVFYNYLRNDDQYKNNRQISSDMPGEKYFTKGSSDSKKLFVVIWLMVILVLTATSLWLYSFNNGLV